MMTVEREISSIETANINKETLDAMKNASTAMKNIHGGLTIDKVDQTMEDLREQHAIGEEIAEALTQGSVGQGVDEQDLDDELEELQQEQLDNKMLKTGSVPVGDQISSMPDRPVGEREYYPLAGGGAGGVRDALLTFACPQLLAECSARRKMMRKQSSRSCRLRWLYECSPGVLGK